jgi:thiol:disulfide interchange protein DsbD
LRFERRDSASVRTAALAALAGGLLVSLTPCVYPMIAVTVSVFGARQAKGPWEGALLSLSFVFGIVAMFVPIGVLAGLSGSVFGAVLQNRWVIVAMALLFLALAASLFGAFEFGLPASITNRLALMGGIGHKGAFLLGLACGLIAAPCTGPVLTGILTWIARTQSAPLGAMAMTTFALGLGFPFFLVGTFAVQLPKSGPWMVHVKSALGLVLVVVALYFLNTAFPSVGAWAKPGTVLYVVAGAAVLLGLALGAVHREFGEFGAGVKAAKALGIVLVSGGAFALFTALGTPSAAPAWRFDLDVARAEAAKSGQPLLIDFTAAWCGACKQLDRKTFAAPDVQPELERFLKVKVDATNDDDPKVEATMERYAVVGLPTVLVFDSSGKEKIRYTDFVEAEPFLEAIRRID